MMETLQHALQSLLGFRYHGYPVGAGGSALLALLLLTRRFQPRPKKGGTAQSRRNLLKIHPHPDPAVRRKFASEVSPRLRPQAPPPPASPPSSLPTDASSAESAAAPLPASGRER